MAIIDFGGTREEVVTRKEQPIMLYQKTAETA